MVSSSKKLKSVAEKFISIKDLFPRGIDLRKNFTPYQQKKIQKAYKWVENSGGAYAHEMVPMGTGRKKYMQENNLPPYQRGIFLPGGAKVNKKVTYKNGEVNYLRGNAPRSRTELDTRSETQLISSGKKILENRNHRKTSITSNGRVIGSAQGFRDNQSVLKEAAYIWNKYSEMAHSNEIRTSIDQRTGKERNVLAAHPNLWGMGILFETTIKEKKNAKEKNRKGK